MTPETTYEIGLIFNANKVYDRQIIEGIGSYLQSSKINWNVFLEEDCVARVNSLDSWQVDGIIADFDNPRIVNAVTNRNLPCVGLGSSFSNIDEYPNAHYIATDNHAVIELAFKHLKDKGIKSFAFYGIKHNESHKWARERMKSFEQISVREGFSYSIFLGGETRPASWSSDMQNLSVWIKSLPKQTGIIAVTDARARHCIEACMNLGIEVPDNISVVGIDDDDIARNLCRISLSSVSQGCVAMGMKAAQIMHQQLTAKYKLKSFKRILVPPSGLQERQSTDFKSFKDPHVVQAMFFIRQNATKGIKVQQVLDFVGVSRSNLEHKFQFECNCTIHAEIHRVKLVEACKLLQESNDSLKAVASKAGYPSVQYMYAIFKKHFEKTPNEYRFEHQSKRQSD